MLSNKRKTPIRSSCACAKYLSGLCSPIMHTVVSNDYVGGQRRLWSDWADAQADLGLRCPHMPEGMFPYGVAQMRSVFLLAGIRRDAMKNKLICQNEVARCRHVSKVSVLPGLRSKVEAIHERFALNPCSCWSLSLGTEIQDKTFAVPVFRSASLALDPFFCWRTALGTGIQGEMFAVIFALLNAVLVSASD